MLMRTCIDTILARCAALKLHTSATGAVDASAVELMLLHVLQGLCDTYDWECFMRIGDPLFVTVPGERTYALPDDWQRFLMPKDEDDTGLWLHNGTSEGRLKYRDAETFRRQWSTQHGPPGYYTVLAGPLVSLDPAPDTVSYRGVGTYIRTITPELLDGNVPLLFPAGLVEMTLALLATDASHPTTPLLLAQAEQARIRLVNAHARMGQRFQSRTSRYHHVARIH